MPEENYQKIKLLKIMEILRQETDEEHPMTKVELAARLVAMNVSCSPRSLIRDIKLLNEQGYEIMERLIGHEKAYFVCDRSFSVPELKILIDAVQAASFVTEKKTGELVDKIAALGGSHRAAILKGNMVKFNARKHRNETVYYTVGYLEDAIKQNRKPPSSPLLWNSTILRKAPRSASKVRSILPLSATFPVYATTICSRHRSRRQSWNANGRKPSATKRRSKRPKTTMLRPWATP